MLSTDPTSIENVQLTLIDSIDSAMEFKRWLGQSRYVLGFDTETGGLEAWSQPLRTVQFGDAMQGWVMPWNTWGGVALEVFKTYEGEMVGHNLKFDAGFAERHMKVKFPWHRAHDSMIECHIVDPTLPIGLKPAAQRMVHPRATSGQEMLEAAKKAQGWTWATIPVEFPGYWAYGALDAVLAARVHEVQHPIIQSRYQDVYDLELAVLRVVMGMEQRGARIDVEYCGTKMQELLDWVEEIQKWCMKEYGVKNIGSNPQVTSRLIADGVELTETTPTGKWKLDEEVIEYIQHPLANAVRDARKATKIANTYFLNFINMRDGDRLHPNIKTVGARTGRMSIERPALQTLPRGRIVRDAFIPSEGHVLLSADYDQVEMRLLAHFAQDQAMIDAINSGDLHTETARRVYGDPSIGKKDPRRQTAKNAGFAKIYGAGAEKFAKTAGISVQEAYTFLGNYDMMFPGVRAFQKQVELVARQRVASDGVAWIRTPLGRVLPADQGKEYTLVNYLIQGTADDVLKRALVDLDLVGLGDMLVVPVHDEVIIDAPLEDAAEVAELVRTTMTQTNWTVPLTAGVEGPFTQWGEKYAA
jgi:DNA polymerase-1